MKEFLEYIWNLPLWIFALSLAAASLPFVFFYCWFFLRFRKFWKDFDKDEAEFFDKSDDRRAAKKSRKCI